MNAFFIFFIVLLIAYILYYGFAISQDVIMARRQETPDSEDIDAPSSGSNSETSETGIKCVEVRENADGSFTMGGKAEADEDKVDETTAPPSPAKPKEDKISKLAQVEAKQTANGDIQSKIIHDTYVPEKTNAQKSVETTVPNLDSIDTETVDTALCSESYAMLLENKAKESAGDSAQVNQTDEELPNGKSRDRI